VVRPHTRRPRSSRHRLARTSTLPIPASFSHPLPRPATWFSPSSSLPAARSTADMATIPTRTSLASPMAQRSPPAPARVSSTSSVPPQNSGPLHYLTEHRSSISPTLRLSPRGFTSDPAVSWLKQVILLPLRLALRFPFRLTFFRHWLGVFHSFNRENGWRHRARIFIRIPRGPGDQGSVRCF
jgi:hypothetical protein